jgi:hypothetical protein
MAAIANNPAFAKKVGVPQSVGKDYAAADKGKKFAAGGALAKINKPDTKHGAMDMPFKKLTKFAGMKKGGKIKRYEFGGEIGKGGDPDEGLNSYAEPQKSVKTEEGPQKMEEMKMPSRPVAKTKTAAPAPVPAAKSAEAKATPSDTTNAGAATSMAPRGQLGRLAAKSAGLSDEAKEAAGKRTGMAIAGFAPIGRAVQGLRALGAGASRARGAMDKAAEGMASRYRGETNPRGWENMSLLERARATGMKKGGSVDKGVDKKLPTGKQMGALGMKSGGMKESKAMVGKEVAFMKKKGAPKSMIKHEAAEMGAMKKGGMAKYAKGGGIESKGKTEGKMVKMAKGGMSSSSFNTPQGNAAGFLDKQASPAAMAARRAKTSPSMGMQKFAAGGVVKFAKGGGIESKGKTKGTMIKMKGC